MAFVGIGGFQELLVEVTHRSGIMDVANRKDIYVSHAQQSLNKLLRTNAQRVTKTLVYGGQDADGPNRNAYRWDLNVSDYPIRSIRFLKQTPTVDEPFRQLTDEQFDIMLGRGETNNRYKLEKGPGSSLIYTLKEYEPDSLHLAYYSDFPDITSIDFWGQDGAGKLGVEFGEIVLQALLHQVYIAYGQVDKATATSDYITFLLGIINSDADDEYHGIDSIHIGGPTP